jgi:hypothetical protein
MSGIDTNHDNIEIPTSYSICAALLPGSPNFSAVLLIVSHCETPDDPNIQGKTNSQEPMVQFRTHNCE